MPEMISIIKKEKVVWKHSWKNQLGVVLLDVVVTCQQIQKGCKNIKSLCYSYKLILIRKKNRYELYKLINNNYERIFFCRLFFFCGQPQTQFPLFSFLYAFLFLFYCEKQLQFCLGEKMLFLFSFFFLYLIYFCVGFSVLRGLYF